MAEILTKEKIITSLLTAFKEVQDSVDATDEIIASSKPSEDFVYIDSEILVQITGVISAELEIEISVKCQLFVGENGEPLTIEQVADKLLQLNSLNGTR